jgi:hypothetical protein
MMSSGKSFWARKAVADLVTDFGVNVIISVHDNKARAAYYEYFKSQGIEVFCLSSHAAIFGHQATPPKEASLADYDCGFYYEIQEEHKIGVPSSLYKSEYCESCPLFETCHYPNQYTQVMDEKYKVVIIQHAHLKCTEVMAKLLRKGFAAMFIDETFIDNLFDSVKIEQMEIDILEAMPYEWCGKMSAWLKRTDRARGKIEPTKEELEDLYNTFQAWETQNSKRKAWRIPDLVRFYNQHRIVDSLSGIQVVHEIPHVPVRVFLDATPPKELIKHLTGISDLVEYGQGEVIDLAAIHPDNRRFQILDMSNSVTQMAKQSYFEVLLKKICEIIERDYGYKKVLITVYKKQITQVKEYIKNNFPHLLDAPYVIDIGIMNKGTNKWADFDAQFILAGRYSSGREYIEEAYNYRCIANWFRLKNGETLLRNPYPSKISDKTSVTKRRKPVKILQKINGKARIVEYSEYFYLTAEHEKGPQKSPHNDYFWYALKDERDVNEMMQAERIRPNTERPIFVYHCHNRPILGLLINEVLTFSQFLTL